MNNINDHLYRCIILECHDQYLHVLTDQGEHLRIKNLANHHIGDKIYVLDEDIIRDTVDSNENKAIKIIDFIKPLSAIAAILLIVFFINFTMSNITYAVISLDINPSIELELNKSGEVIHAKGFNTEAIELLSNLQLKGFSYEKAIDAILNQAMLLGYTIDQHSVLIAVAPIKAQIEGLISDIENHLVIYTEQLGAEVKIGDQNSYTNEKNHDISLGRNLLSNENPNIDENDMKNMKIRDIFEYIEKDQHQKNEEETKEHLDSEDGKELEHEDDNSSEIDKINEEDKHEEDKHEVEKKDVQNDDQSKDSDDHEGSEDYSETEHDKDKVDTTTITTHQENTTVEESHHSDDGDHHETESEKDHENESNDD
ncbi:anti-sigma factor domain-containing protein [Fusibacter bizertensis]|uniref:Anti-sigma factor domain-containing protein n=1 Tax=Fusibacter bizertensis TaxID=1488331 RepID=A0ABT6NG33_9FIRM|nr:anti-sigma factor domain-containing protein [Fusibacter bizertensis]MDH8679352.1 anti-sigma factor domain-containing protein [Fusibacter bizertensis]